MVQQQKETEFKKAYEKETGELLLTEDDGLEDLELYLGQTYGFSLPFPFFLIFHYPTHSVLTFCLPKKLLFVYLQLPKYPFCLPSYYIVVLLYYRSILANPFRSTFLKLLFIYLHGLHAAFFYGQL